MMKILRFAFVALLVSATGACSDPETGPSMNSESHFLQRCVGHSDCGDEYSCLCFVCSLPCDDSSGCGETVRETACLSLSLGPLGETCMVDGIAADVQLCLPECASQGDCISGEVCTGNVCLSTLENDEDLDLGFPDLGGDLTEVTEVDLSEEPEFDVTEDRGIDLAEDTPVDTEVDMDDPDGGDDLADVGPTLNGLGAPCSTDEDCVDMTCNLNIGLCGEACRNGSDDCSDGQACHVPGDVEGICLDECAACGADVCNDGYVCEFAVHDPARDQPPEEWEATVCMPPNLRYWPLLCHGGECWGSCSGQDCGAASDGCQCGTCGDGDACFSDECVAIGDCPAEPCADAFGGLLCEGMKGYRACPGDSDRAQLCLCTGAGWGSCDDICVDFSGPRVGERCVSDTDCNEGSCSDVYNVCEVTCSAGDRTCPEGTYCHVPGDTAGICLKTCEACGSDECGVGLSCDFDTEAGAPDGERICYPPILRPDGESCVGVCAESACGEAVCGATESGCHCGSCASGTGCFVSDCNAPESCPGETPCEDAFGGDVCEGTRGYRTCPDGSGLYQSCTCDGTRWFNCSTDCVTF